jgi:hypothetical protein
MHDGQGIARSRLAFFRVSSGRGGAGSLDERGAAW